ncbi:hypothetical protein CHS0354_016854 [Potamilus streckersoni]|uniref:Uncharacterized protein n=1 Tax=Potamilus streckersoni TaxID=2493646 RepID=A0AAE0W356_9BIVA|nr:hypothetical protein CHS0354_016854 [Potamilus streckersoni]
MHKQRQQIIVSDYDSSDHNNSELEIEQDEFPPLQQQNQQQPQQSLEQGKSESSVAKQNNGKKYQPPTVTKKNKQAKLPAPKEQNRGNMGAKRRHNMSLKLEAKKPYKIMMSKQTCQEKMKMKVPHQ